MNYEKEFNDYYIDVSDVLVALYSISVEFIKYVLVC